MSDDDSLNSNQSWRSRQSVKSQTVKGTLKKNKLNDDKGHAFGRPWTHKEDKSQNWIERKHWWIEWKCEHLQKWTATVIGMHNETTEATADHAGRECDKEMRELIINGDEMLTKVMHLDIPEPTKDETVNPFAMEKL